MNALARIVIAMALLAVVAPSAQAAFPGRNGAIAFAQRTATGDSVTPSVEHTRLAVRSLRGGDPRILVDCELTDGAPSGGDCSGTNYHSPSYSADGDRIVFDAGERIGLIGAGGAGLSLLSAVTGDDGDPAFAPGGGRIVFTGDNSGGTTDVYVRRLAGGEARLIARDATEPAWSSRNEIAYVRGGRVFAVRPDGTGRRLITRGLSPDWSPSGRRLLLVRPDNNVGAPFGRILMVGAGGRVLRRVGSANDRAHPVWSPDGRWIAFSGFDLGVFAKRLGSRAPARQIAPTQISGESGVIASHDPTWRPRPR